MNAILRKALKHTVLKVISFVNYMQTVDEQNQVKNNISKIGYNFSKIQEKLTNHKFQGLNQKV